MKQLAVVILHLGILVVAGCSSIIFGEPLTMSRPVTIPDAGGFDCVSATLVELGYTLAERDGAKSPITGSRFKQGWLIGWDVLVVSHTSSPDGTSTLEVKAFRRRGTEGTDDLGFSTLHENAPSDETLADAERVLTRCAGVQPSPSGAA